MIETAPVNTPSPENEFTPGMAPIGPESAHFAGYPDSVHHAEHPSLYPAPPSLEPDVLLRRPVDEAPPAKEGGRYPTTLEQGLERDFMELGGAVLQAFAAVISPVEIPRTELTTDPAANREREEGERRRIIASIDPVDRAGHAE